MTVFLCSYPSGCATTGRSTRRMTAANFLASDRFNYDVLKPYRPFAGTAALPGDIDLGHVNWGNYDLVVIDESHKLPQQIDA